MYLHPLKEWTVFGGIRFFKKLKKIHMKMSIKSIAFLLLLFSIGNTNALTAQADLEYFNAIDLRGNLEVNLAYGSETGVDIDKYDWSKVSLEVNGGVLTIKRKKPFKIKEYEDDAIKVTITYNKLNSIKARAGAKLRADHTLNSQHLHLDLNSGAEARLTIEAGELEASASEGAQIQLRGKVESFEAKVATGAQIEAYRLESEYAYIKAVTGGEAEVHASEMIEASAHTGGQVDYRGNPKKVRVNDRLGGDISGNGGR